MVYGYARVSTVEQNLERQIAQLKQYVKDERDIITDKASGKDFNRNGYNMLTGTDSTTPLLRAGDVLVIASIDRLGRNYTEIQEEWRKLTKELNVGIIVIDMPVLNTADTVNSENSLDKQFVADLVLKILSYVAEKERKSIKERQRQGIDVMPVINGKRVSAKTGRATGRPVVQYPENWENVYNKWKNGEITATQAIKDLGLKRTTFYRLVAKYTNNDSI